MKKHTKKIFFSLSAAVCFLLSLSSCGYGYFEARANRAKLADIRIGMTKAEVRQIMGEPPEGVFQGKNVVFYYTDPKWYDGFVTRDECTPFVFDEDEDQLIGFGYDYFRQNYSLADWDTSYEPSWRDTVVRRARQLNVTTPAPASESAPALSLESESTPEPAPAPESAPASEPEPESVQAPEPAPAPAP